MKKILILLFVIISHSIYATTYYVAPSTVTPAGNDAAVGNITHPWLTWDKAFQTAVAGDTVFFRGGVYPMTVSTGLGIKIDARPGHGYNEGTRANPICYFNYPGEVPILDCSNVTSSTGYNFAIRVWYADFLHFKGLTIRNVYQKGSLVIIYGFSVQYTSNNVILENMDLYRISGVAYNMGGEDSVYVINCDAHTCCDTTHATLPGQFGTGFETNNTSSDNMFVSYYGCRAWNCSDNGFAGRPWGHVKIDRCWSFANGGLMGGGEGFKISGIDASYRAAPTVQRTVINSVTAYNLSDGINSNAIP